MARPKTPTAHEERVARQLCVIRGLDPEERVMDGPLDGTGHAVLVKWFRWHHLVLTEVRPLLECLAAVQSVEREDEAPRG